MASIYNVPVIPVSCMELDEFEIKRILAQLLFEFHIKEIKVDIPKWLVMLDKDHWLKTNIFDAIKRVRENRKIRQVQDIMQELDNCEYINSTEIKVLIWAEALRLSELILTVNCFIRYFPKNQVLTLPTNVRCSVV